MTLTIEEHLAIAEKQLDRGNIRTASAHTSLARAKLAVHKYEVPPRWINCPGCAGAGRVADVNSPESTVTCYACNGNGVIVDTGAPTPPLDQAQDQDRAQEIYDDLYQALTIADHYGDAVTAMSYYLRVIATLELEEHRRCHLLAYEPAGTAARPSDGSEGSDAPAGDPGKTATQS